MKVRFRGVILLVLVGACADPAPEPGVAPGPPQTRGAPAGLEAGPPGIRGIVTAADPESLRVEENPAEAAGSPKAVVRLTSGTRVVFLDGVPAPPGELGVGDTVSVWFAGPVLESYPVQGTAETIAIETSGGL